MRRVLASDDPTNEIGAAWGCKELLRQLLAATGSTYSCHLVSHRLHRFLELGLTNARTRATTA